MNPTHRFNEMVAVRDGTALATDLFFPAGDGPHPTVLLRTPYNKNMPLVTKVVEPWNARGYAVVVQDVRGWRAADPKLHPRREVVGVERDRPRNGILYLSSARPWAIGNKQADYARSAGC